MKQTSSSLLFKFDRDQLLRIISLSFITIVVLGASIHGYSNVRQYMHGYIGGIIAVGKTQPAYLALASTSHVVLVPGYSAQAQPVQAQAESVTHHKIKITPPYGMFERNDHKIVFLQGNVALSKAMLDLNERWSQDQAPRFQWLLALVAFLIGIPLSRFLLPLGALVPATLASFAGALLARRCQTCPNTDLLFGYDVALWALTLFLAATIAALFLSDPKATLLVAIVLLITSASQCVLFLRATTTCYFCLSIFGLTALYLGSCLKVTNRTLSMQRIVRWGMAVPLALYFGLAYQPRPAQAQVSVAKTRLALNDPVLKGRNIGSLGIRRNAGAPPIKGPSLVLIGSSTCEACRWALRWASTQSFAPLVKVSNVAGGEVTDEEGYVFDAPNSGIASPSLLLIDGSGTIIDEEYGWAESTIFKKALEERFARALAGAKTESRRTKS